MVNEILESAYWGKLPVVDIDLTTTLEEIGDESCVVCEGPTQRDFLEHICYGGIIAVRSKKTAGFHCNSCDVWTYSPKAIAEALTKAGEIMTERGDQTTPVHFQDIISSLKV